MIFVDVDVTSAGGPLAVFLDCSQVTMSGLVVISSNASKCWRRGSHLISSQSLNPRAKCASNFCFTSASLIWINCVQMLSKCTAQFICSRFMAFPMKGHGLILLNPPYHRCKTSSQFSSFLHLVYFKCMIVLSFLHIIGKNRSSLVTSFEYYRKIEKDLEIVLCMPQKPCMLVKLSNNGNGEGLKYPKHEFTC